MLDLTIEAGQSFLRATIEVLIQEGVERHIVYRRWKNRCELKNKKWFPLAHVYDEIDGETKEARK
jgi:hypothetical protein